MKFSNNEGKMPLKIISLGGTEAVNKDLTVYECGDDIIIVDCGIGFPDSEMLGVDVVIPDITYLLERKEKIRGLLITHAHEDHMGAVPYVLSELNVPIYTGKLVQGLLKEALSDKKFKGVGEGVSFNLISPDTPEVDLGCFKISAFRVNHSVPASMGFAIRTPQGLIVHVSDFKVDWTPVLDKPIELGKIAKLGDEGVLCLLSDCLGAATDGYSKSESSLNETFSYLFERSEGRQILVTSISSNIARMHQIISAAIKHGRKVVFSGRSIETSASVARNLGYLKFDDSVFVSEQEAKNYLQSELVYIIAGCYGQSGSSLGRLSRGEHRDIELEENALVVFSADPNPPGVEEAVNKVMDNLTLLGSEVVYSQIQENLHVSGHGTRGDLTILAAVVKPKHFIPIGGTVTKMRAYRDMIEELGFDGSSVFELMEGESVEFVDGKAYLGENIETEPVYIDGSTKDSIGPAVLRDREVLCDDGVFVVVVPFSKKSKEYLGNPSIVTRGFVYVKESKDLINKATGVVNKHLSGKKEGSDWGKIKSKVERELGKFLFKETGRKPLVLISSLRV